MDILELRDYLVSLPMVEETMPFSDGEAAVYRIGGKWFAVFIFARPECLAVKCEPMRAVLLREEYYGAINPAWHFNKRHWNDLRIAELPDEVVKREIRHSYLTVIHKNVSPKTLREELLRIAEAAGVVENSL